jgi:hypothetical protein
MGNTSSGTKLNNQCLKRIRGQCRLSILLRYINGRLMKGCVASLEATSLFENLRRTYRSPRDLTSKFTKGAGCSKRVGSQV